MSRAMLAADATAMVEGYHDGAHEAAHASRRARVAGAPVPLARRLQGVAAGVAFLAVRIPVYAGVLVFGAIVSLGGIALYAVQAAGLRLSRVAGALAVLILCIATPQRAHATVISDPSALLTQTEYITNSMTTLSSFEVPSAGTLSVYLDDLDFPVALQQFTTSILGDDGVLGSWSQANASTSGWEFSVPIQAAGTFDAFVAAQAGDLNGLALGAYTMQITFQPATVPLPAALDLLLGGLGLLGAVALLERISADRNKGVMSLP